MPDTVTIGTSDHRVIGRIYIDDAVLQMRMLKDSAEKACAQITDEQLFTQIDPDANSIALIMKHMAGNMRSRWTDFLTSDGEKATRQRDLEFEIEGADTGAKVRAAWADGWTLTLDTIASLAPDDLKRTIRIRNQELGVVHAINRQLTHYAEHVGQIIMLAKHFAGPNWKSLTIPKRKVR